MARAVSPSNNSITKGQAGKFADLLVQALGKSGLPSAETQQVLEEQGASLAAQFIALVRTQVDMMSKFIRRTVPVDRTLLPEAAIIVTGRTQYVTASVVASMPNGVGDTADIVWIPLKKGMSNKAVVKKLAEFKLTPVDPFALAAHNEVEPDFAKDHPNFTLWQDAAGNWCYAAFYDWDDERYVDVYRVDSDWDDDWWVAAVAQVLEALPTRSWPRKLCFLTSHFACGVNFFVIIKMVLGESAGNYGFRRPNPVSVCWE